MMRVLNKAALILVLTVGWVYADKININGIGCVPPEPQADYIDDEDLQILFRDIEDLTFDECYSGIQTVYQALRVVGGNPNIMIKQGKQLFPLLKPNGNDTAAQSLQIFQANHQRRGQQYLHETAYLSHAGVIVHFGWMRSRLNQLIKHKKGTLYLNVYVYYALSSAQMTKRVKVRIDDLDDFDFDSLTSKIEEAQVEGIKSAVNNMQYTKKFIDEKDEENAAQIQGNGSALDMF